MTGMRVASAAAAMALSCGFSLAATGVPLGSVAIFLADATGGSLIPQSGPMFAAGLRPGDANGDGMVDQADYTIWYNHYGMTGAHWADADFTGDGQVDQADYTIWYNNYGAPPPTVSTVAQVKVMSDKNPLDVSSPAAWKRSFIPAGMSDKDKALAVWRSVVTYQHQDGPPNEYLQDQDNVLDPLKLFNVYGYSLCSVAASEVACLARYAGLEAQNWGINAHNVAEVKWGGAWHLLDASLINYFPKPGGGDLASVPEIQAAVAAWYAANPGYKGDGTALYNYQVANGWTQWKTGGPALLANSPFYDATGWWPARTHGWYSTMQEYDGSTSMILEPGSSMGYQVNIQLRPGEAVTRNWYNNGLHVNGPGNNPGSMTDVNGQGDMVYCPNYGDIAPGRLGNGTHVYTVPVGDSEFQYAAWRFDNLVSRGTLSPALGLANSATDGYLEIRVPSSYVYLTGTLTMNVNVESGGSVDVKFSDNNGTSWKDVAAYTTAGAKAQDLKGFCFRRYDYRLRFTIHGAGTGINSMTISHDIQHSQRPLPALLQGTNTLTFTAGTEGTVTIEGNCRAANASRQVLYTDYNPVLVNCTTDGPTITVYSPQTGSLTQTIRTPADMKRLRVSGYYRARDAGDKWDVQASFDGGATYGTVATWSGPFRDMTKYIDSIAVPAGTRTAKVRFLGTQKYNTACLFNHRIDADYDIPNGGFRPVKVTYTWKESGVDKQDVHIANTPNEVYTIHCATKPTMRSIKLELAP